MTKLPEKAEVLAEAAKKSYAERDFFTASKSFEQAAQAYATSGEPLMAAEMKNNQCVSLLKARQPQQALHAVSGTESVFEAAGDQKRLGMAYANHASACADLKQHSTAIEYYEKASSAFEQAGEDQMRLQVMQLLATLQLSRFKFINAVIALQSGLAGVKEPTPKQRLIKKILFIRL